jgi:hypothetical protein
MSGYNPYSQYSSLYSQSLSNQMLGMQRSASSQQDYMLSQQQVYAAQQRSSQIIQNSGSMYGSIGGSMPYGYGAGGYGGVGTGGIIGGALVF